MDNAVKVFLVQLGEERDKNLDMKMKKDIYGGDTSCEECNMLLLSLAAYSFEDRIYLHFDEAAKIRLRERLMEKFPSLIWVPNPVL